MFTATQSTVTFLTAKRFDLIVVSKKTGKEIERMIGSDQFDRIHDAIASVKECNDDYDVILNDSNGQNFTSSDLEREMNIAFNDYRHTVRFYNRRFPKNECPKCSENAEWSELVQDRIHDREGNDNGMAMICMNCNYSQSIESNLPLGSDRLEDSPSTDC